MKLPPHRVAGLCLLVALILAAGPTCGAAALRKTFAATDTYDPPPDPSPAAQRVLEAVSWRPEAFIVTAIADGQGDYDARIEFPSPRPQGDPEQDTVAMWWYAARGEDGRVIEAPAVLVVHTLHPRMVIGQAIARGFAERGLHAFLVQLPGYGQRQGAAGKRSAMTMMEHAEQGVADVRRARDAIAVLPNVAPGPIALEGTSLGGFVGSVAASLDGAFDPVMLALSGAQLTRVLEDGQKDAARVRIALAEAGYGEDEVRALLERVEPGAVAHRLDPQRTWLFTAADDLVVPRANSDALADAIGLEPSHRVQIPGNHYTGLLVLPGIVEMMSRIVQGEMPETQPRVDAGKNLKPQMNTDEHR